MILSRLTVNGFKSFAKKIDLRFDGKITSVVGPNGCGKTNIVDAIRWGLGEQRPSILRTDRMENVIFGGAQSSKPLGMAEVSLTFDNSNHVLPIDYSEVTITRRLYRSGESEYLINKNRVRLKDVNDLIMDTGVGADAYSVIELKMIEDILSERAEDRRKLLEEAAGVTKYKHRLKAAMRKLDATQNDLLRVNDIIREVERSVTSLKRQVGRARRYKEYQELVRDLELNTSVYLFNKLKEEIAPLQKELNGLNQQKDGSSTEITKEEADLETIRLTLAEQERDLVKIREDVALLVEEIHKRESDIRVGKERTGSLKERITRYTKEIENLKKRLEDQENHLVVTGRDREAIQVRITSSNRIFENKKKELEVFMQGLNMKRLNLNEKKKAVIECLEKVNSLTSSETNMRTRIDNSQGRMERLEEEDKTYREIIRKSETDSKEFRASIDVLNIEHAKIQNHSEALKEKEKTLRESIDKTRESFFDTRSRLELVEGRLNFYKNMLDNQEGVSDGSKWLIKQNMPGLFGIVADLIDAEPEHRQAIAASLGEASGYLLVDKLSNAYTAIDKLKQRRGGRVSMICLEKAGSADSSRTKAKINKDVKVVGWADELIKYNKEIKPVVEHLLGDVLIVEDMESARLAIESSVMRGMRAATLEGELITSWGGVYSGDKTGQDSTLVGRVRRIKELEKEIESLKKKVGSLKNTIGKKEDELEETKKLIAESDKNLSEIKEKLRKTEYDYSRIEFESQKAEEGLKSNAVERQKLLKEIEQRHMTIRLPILMAEI